MSTPLHRDGARSLTVLPGASQAGTCVSLCCAPHHTSLPSSDWLAGARRARLLSWFSLVWMAAEGMVGLVAGLRDSSVSLVGWALGSIIEGLASIIVIWRFTGARMLCATAELRAHRAVAVSFFLLAPYVAVLALHDLFDGHAATPGLLGMAVTASSVVLMPLLGLAKRRLSEQLGSGATAGEGVQNLMCAAQGAAVLIGLVATAAFGWRSLDPVIALGLAGWAIREGILAWRGDDCC